MKRFQETIFEEGKARGGQVVDYARNGLSDGLDFVKDSFFDGVESTKKAGKESWSFLKVS